MARFNSIYEHDRGVIEDVRKINGQIEDELQSATPDNEKLLKLRMQSMLRGMELNAGISANRYGMRPY